MSKKIYISCAPSGLGQGSNYGMLTVDFAIYNIVKNIPNKNIILSSPWVSYSDEACVQALKKRDNFPMHFSYDLAQFDKLDEGDAVFFWGDFQWGYDFQVQSASRLQKSISNKIGGPIGRAFEKIKKRFLLKELYVKKFDKFDLMSYGTTLFQNRMSDLSNVEYADNLKWLINKAKFIKFRDSYSSTYAAGVRNDFKNSYLGLDAALLNTKEELLSLAGPDTSFANSYISNIGYYFGRSSKAFPKYYVVRFLKQIGKITGKKLIKIPWNYFSSGLFTDPLALHLRLLNVKTFKDNNNSFLSGDILSGMSKCALIVTDTYHVAINAIVLNIPVIMIPEFRSSNSRDANMGYIESWRDKRILLFQNNSLSDLMVLPDLLKDKDYIQKKMNIINNVIKNNQMLSMIYSSIHNQAVYDRRLITDNILQTDS